MAGAPQLPLERRDAETLELVGDFLEESAEGLARADELLAATERGGADAEQTHALFRVFHTIKGVAGFLELSEIVSLAHATEALLNLVREGQRALGGDVHAAVLESAAVLRRLLDRLRAAVDAGTELDRDPAVEPLVARIQRISEGGGADAGAPAAPAPAPAPEGEAGSPRASGRLRETVKVDVERVDAIVEMVGELMIVEAMVVHDPEIAALCSLRVRNSLGQLAKISRDLQSVAMRMRMVPVRGVFRRMARLARDLARKAGKAVAVETAGEDTELDRSMVERLEEPLVHLVRNAMDHGVEPAAERRAAGKPEVARIRLAAAHEGGAIVVELSDDGRGLRRDRILARARELGLVEDGAELHDEELHELLFRPGFSTAAAVTEISGRGVGMDVVRRNVEAARGRVTLSSLEGRGTTVRIALPLTLAVIDGLLVACGAERYVLPSLAVLETLRPGDVVLSGVAGLGEAVLVRDEILPLFRLHRLLGVPGEERPIDGSGVVVVEGAGRKIALVVDDVVAQQQVVIKPLGAGLGDVPFVAGAAILPDGRVGLILDADRLASLAARASARRRAAGAVG